MAHDLKPDDFRELASPLTIEQPGGAPIELEVESVNALPSHRLRPEPFSLVLRGPQAPLLAQATYRVRHPRQGVLDLFLVPIARDAGCTRYEVTFN
jgi:hypothetical protein